MSKKSENLFQSMLPTGRQITIIIMLGICGSFFTLQYLLSNIKLTGHHKGIMLINYGTKTIEKKGVKTKEKAQVDTLQLVYHPTISAHLDDLKVERINNLKLHLKHNTFNQNPIVKDINYSDIYFSYNPAFLVWIALITIMMGCTLSIIPLLYNLLYSTIKVFNLSLTKLVEIMIIALIILKLFSITNVSNHLIRTFAIAKKLDILFINQSSVLTLTILPKIVGAIAIGGQLLVNSAIGKLNPLASLTNDELIKTAQKFSILKDRLKSFLLIDSVLIVFSVLASDAFRRAIVSEVQINHDLNPPTFGYLYGIMFTFYLAIFYIPIYYHLKYKGEEIYRKFPQVTDIESQKAKELLLIHETPMESLTVALSILAPIITSLVPGLLKI